MDATVTPHFDKDGINICQPNSERRRRQGARADLRQGDLICFHRFHAANSVRSMQPARTGKAAKGMLVNRS